MPGFDDSTLSYVVVAPTVAATLPFSVSWSVTASELVTPAAVVYSASATAVVDSAAALAY